ncbi:hypothetical protein LSAT2_011876 [Lamellibrachia satsuma]|nr:hypothetical protein LSAT2_011876 [Lamellibrachia satsuma]
MAESERKVVIAIDASEQAEHAFHWYLTKVHRPENQVVLIHVPEPLEGDRNRMLYLTASAWDDAIKKEQSKVKEIEDKYNGKILEHGVRKILEHGISGRVRSESGNKPGEILCKLAENENATLIVMGTRGLGKVRRTIMGSVSDYVVHHAHCPVIVCRQ